MNRRLIPLLALVLLARPVLVRADKGAQDLVETLRDDDEATAKASEAMLVKIGPDAVRPLQKALNDSNFRVRRRAAETLARLGPQAKRAAPDLVQLLGDAQFDVHAAAEKALIAMGDDAIPALADALKSDQEGLRKMALSTMSRCGPKAIPYFLSLLKKDESPVIRASAAEALGNASPVTPDVTLGLVQALSDLEEGVRSSAADSLGLLGASSQSAIRPLFSVSQDDHDALTRKKAADALAQIGKSSKEAGALVAAEYEKQLKSQDTLSRQNAIASLGNLGAAGMPGLIQALSDRDPAVSDQASQTIILVGQDAVPALEQLKQSSFPYLQRKATELLRRIQKKRGDRRNEARSTRGARRAFFMSAFPLGAAGNDVSASTVTVAPTQLGIDVLEEQGYALLQGKQVGLITNQTGVDSRGRSTADLLAKAPGVKLVALFSPEHGIRGTKEHGESVGDAIDPHLRLPVYSLYGSVQKPSPPMLNSIDVLVFDMQDVGARFYTYLTTMGMAMEAAAERGIAFMVLDRPNPLGGAVVEGQVLDSRIRHFTAYYQVPVRHGFTAGELAQWYNLTTKLNVQMTVIAMKDWKRDEIWKDTGLSFVPPSPNIRNATAAILYCGIGMFEATNVAVGRGTDFPFELVGAPWISGDVLAKRLNDLALPGLQFTPALFTPTADVYQGQHWSGVRIKVTDARALRPVDLFVYVSCLLRELWPKDFQPRWDEVARVTGSHDFEHLYIQNKSAADILVVFHKSADDFVKSRQPYLLY